MARINKKRFKHACKGSGGVQTVIAKSIGVGRSAISEYLKKHPDMRKFVDEEGEQIIDVGEHHIDKEIVAGNTDVIQWALINRKKGKARGYGPRQEIEQIGESHIIFKEVTKSYKDIKDGRKRDLTKSKANRNS
ncbi:MAG: hypothetical protein QQN41_00150 [Nitrosopumilus sp.]